MYETDDQRTVTYELKLVLPEKLAREVEANGLLTAQALEALLWAEVRRRRINKLFEVADRLAGLDMLPLTEAEVEAEIAAARRERSVADARGG